MAGAARGQAPRGDRRRPGVGLLAVMLGLLAGGLACPAAAGATSPPDHLGPGSSLPAGSSLASHNGAFRLAMQRDGNLVLYGARAALWQTGTRGHSLRLVMEAAGNLVIGGGRGAVSWRSGTSSPGSHLELQDDGNLVVYSASGKALWQSGSEAYHGCPRNTADAMARTGSGSELITVVATRYDTTYAALRRWEKEGGCWRPVGSPVSARIGYSGLKDHRHEGDGSTPTGLYGIGPVMFGIDPTSPNSRYPYHHLVCGDWWDEDPASRYYNTFQHVACGTTPSWATGSEALWTEAPAYEHFAVIDFNMPPHGPLGSGIFLHDDTGGPTDGCVSLPANELDEVLSWLSPSSRPEIAIGTSAESRRL